MYHFNRSKQLCQERNLPDYDLRYVTDKAEAWRCLHAINLDEVYALDFETTGLSPLEGEVRLTTVFGHGTAFILDHKYCGLFEEYAEHISHGRWAVFNSLFEGDFIDTLADNMNVELLDVGHMKRAKMGGGPMSLAIQVKRDLKIDMDKTEQNSNWSRPELTQEQVDYAMFDGVVTWLLWEKWYEELSPAQYEGFLVINDAWRGTLEMQQTGMCLDIDYHKTLIDKWEMKRNLCLRYLRKFTPESVIPNLASNKQLSDFFKRELDKASISSWPKTGKTGQLKMDQKILRQVAHKTPYPMRRWIAALIRFKWYNKYLSTYGQKLIDRQVNDGYIPTRFNMAAAVTCRYSSSSENLQNIPRAPYVRRSFIAKSRHSPKRGDLKFVIADYSSVEVRVLAELSGDEQLLHDAIYGDVHSRSASQIFNIDFEYFYEVIHSDDDDPRYANVKPAFKDMRSRAKGFTFQLLYGAGAAALSIVLRCSEEEAAEAIEAWAKTYPKAYHYRTLMFETMTHSGFLPVCDGRTIFVFKGDRSMPVAANYPVQGAAGSVMYRAVYHTHKMLSDSGYEASMCATVHDEMVLLASERDAEHVKKLLEDAMVQGWLDIFPDTDTHGVVEGAIGNHWGDKK